MTADPKSIKMTQALCYVNNSKLRQQPVLVQVDKANELVAFDDLNVIKEREKAVNQIARDMIDLNNLMRDVSILVNEQGEIVENIEISMSKSRLNTENATNELVKTENYQKSSSWFQTKIMTAVTSLITAGVTGAVFTLVILL
ncbi:Hypothetical protein HVR_LOCUS1066 [uncultured virus]|nr:Hypothetical protein HVR_LOCUS1066 [uncultured virus]